MDAKLLTAAKMYQIAKPDFIRTHSIQQGILRVVMTIELWLGAI